MKTILAVALLLLPLHFIAQVKINAPAPEIALPSGTDSIIKLSAFRGKVVLVDFWASWCGPCRMANPFVVKLYNKYKAQGFEVFGVSLDTKKTAWLKAVKKDKITYTQVIDTDGWQSKVAERYGVEAIPASFLITKDGIIAAIDAEGKWLEEKIKQLLGQ
ncbi:MAG TPA: TlpA disulfide reductase family protein [Ferruginibacter sp.]|nr:TlpA disulfide reductase family protein [Ferruginibacter sp.]HMP20913.1 TlpA disulfide reductase family protein [Ferruginibacter sp.]